MSFLAWLFTWHFVCIISQLVLLARWLTSEDVLAIPQCISSLTFLYGGEEICEFGCVCVAGVCGDVKELKDTKCNLRQIFVSGVIWLISKWYLNKHSKSGQSNHTLKLTFDPCTDIDWRSQNLHYFITAWGSNWGYLGFSHNRNNSDLSGATVVGEWRLRCIKRSMVHEDCENILFAFVYACVVGKNPITHSWSSMADYAITRGSIGEFRDLLSISVDPCKVAFLNVEWNKNFSSSCEKP